MNLKFLVVFLIINLLAGFVAGVQVGVVVEFANSSVFTKCVEIDENASGYEVLQETGLDIEWKYYSAELGHALCGIEDTGCPSSNCFCSSKYWGFYIKSLGGDSWTYSPVGFDGGSSCDEHYCAKDADLIGLIWGEYGEIPSDYSFGRVCPRLDADDDGTVSDSELLDYINHWARGLVSDFDLLDAIDLWAGKV